MPTLHLALPGATFWVAVFMTLHVEQLQGRRQDRGLSHTLVTQRTLSSGPVWWAVGPSWQTAATRRCSAAELISFPHIHLHVFILRELRPAGGGGPSPVLLQSQRAWEEEEERKGRCRPCLPSMQTQPAETVTPPPPPSQRGAFPEQEEVCRGPGDPSMDSCSSSAGHRS